MFYPKEEVRKIVENISVLDYFQYLEKQGKVNFDRKSGKDYYFRTDKNKFSVNESGFYDFKTGNSGKIIRAVMSIENKSWKEAVDFLKDFSNTCIPKNIAEIKKNEENKTFFILNSNKNRAEKIVEEENAYTQKAFEQYKPRGFRR